MPLPHLAHQGAADVARGDLWLRRSLTLQGRPRGLHLITDEIVDALPELGAMACGMAQVFIQHTTASLTVNESVEPAVAADLRSWLDDAVAEGKDAWTHADEGPEDMPAHVKASLLDASVLVPVEQGRLLLGRYQGIFLCEHLSERRPRTVVITAWGRTGG